MATTFPGTFQVKRKSAATWTAQNSILLAGELGFETDRRQFKFGDGSTGWNGLEYASADGDGGTGDIDGGTASSIYGGTTAIDGGSA